MADRPAYPGTPRWVKVSGIIAIVIVLLVGFMMLTGGDHGPNRHLPSADTGTQTPPASVTEGDNGGGHTPPAGVHTSS